MKLYLAFLILHLLVFLGVVCCLCWAESADSSSSKCRGWGGPCGIESIAATAEWCVLQAGQSAGIQAEPITSSTWIPQCCPGCKCFFLIFLRHCQWISALVL